MDRLEEYFKKQLNDHTPAEDGWNVPSEGAWQGAIAELDKDRQSESSRMKWIIPFILIILVGFIISKKNEWSKPIEKTPELYTTSSNASEFQTNSHYSTNNYSAQNKVVSSGINSKSPNLSKPSSSPEQSILIDKNTGNVIPMPNDYEGNMETYIPNNQLTKSITEKTSYSPTFRDAKIMSSSSTTRLDEGDHESSNKINEVIFENKLHESLDINYSSGRIHRSAAHSNSSQLNAQSESSSSLSTALMNEENGNNTLGRINEIGEELLKVKTWNTAALEDEKAFSHIPFELNETTIAQSPMIEPIEVKRPKKWEIGISFSDYFFSKPYELWAEDQIGELNNLDLDSDYTGLNIQFAKRLKNKWAIASGLFLSTQHLDLSISQTAFWDSGQSLARSRSNISLTENDLELNLIQGVTLNHGDQLRLEGLVDFDAYSFRVPVAVRYHFNNSFEKNLFLESGVSLGADYFAPSISDIDVYRENVLVGTALGNEQSGIIPQASIYFGFGWRMPLSNKWNWGGGINVDKRVGLIGYYVRSEFGFFYDL